MSALGAVRERLGLRWSEDNPGARIALDDGFEVLRNERRRRTVRYITEEAGEEWDLNEVVAYITELEFGPDYSSQERKRVYVSLYQTHFDTLRKAGVIEPVDSGTHMYRAGPAAAPLYEVLETAGDVLGGGE
ncbi:DUF7344 domain-containing protein [Haloparvum sedimenti]|uniref:DUF7344 domain-containing protein n=1 Tax=Haloparvum sedimenti TaxID=1678448 RepID=UPI00071E747B|nr:hypothetical protein [Haloparvum sedimenti]